MDGLHNLVVAGKVLYLVRLFLVMYLCRRLSADMSFAANAIGHI